MARYHTIRQRILGYMIRNGFRNYIAVDSSSGGYPWEANPSLAKIFHEEADARAYIKTCASSPILQDVELVPVVLLEKHYDD